MTLTRGNDGTSEPDTLPACGAEEFRHRGGAVDDSFELMIYFKSNCPIRMWL